MSMLETLSQMLVLGDAMDGLINTGNSFIAWMQRGAMVSTAIVFCWGSRTCYRNGMPILSRERK